MKSISKILMVIAVALTALTSFAQIKHTKTEIIKVYGNCDRCKAAIEKAGNIKKLSSVNWNKDTKMATLTYDNTRITQDEILKKIALAGYDSEKFLAPDDVYAKLPGCCKYNRTLKAGIANKGVKTDAGSAHASHHHDQPAASVNKDSQNTSQLSAVFDSYFLVKDALIKADAAAASAKASQLASAIRAVDRSKLSANEHTAWMKMMKPLGTASESISTLKNITGQREVFATVSQHMYELAKQSRQDAPVYYQHCPMYNSGKGAHWLSKEKAVRNPYYGSQMLSCGSTIETIP